MAIIDNLKYLLSVDSDDKSFNKAEKNLQSLTKTMKQLAFAGTAIAGFTKLMTDQIVESDRLAKSVGTTADIAEAFGSEMKKIGLNQENFIDLMEEMNNKMGEMKGLGEFTAVEESLDLLNLKFEDLQALSPEEQFKAITKSALELEDAQKAVSAVDMLMGGEANKLIGSLRAQGLTYDDIIRKQQLHNFQTEESRKGALEFANASQDLMRTITSLAKYVAGELGDAMSGLVNEITSWVSANKELVASGVKQFAHALYVIFSAMWIVLRQLGNVVTYVANAFGGFERASQFITSGAMLFGVYKLIQAFGLLGFAIKQIPKLLLKVPILGALILIADDIRSWVSGDNSIMGMIVGDFDTWLPQFIEGLDVLKDLFVFAFDSLSEMVMNTFSAIGDFIISMMLAPVNFIIDSINLIVGTVLDSINSIIAKFNAIGGSTIMKNLGLDFNVSQVESAGIENVSNASAKNAIGNTASSIGNTVLNSVTDVVVNVANATSDEAQAMVKNAIIGSMEHERQKLQSPTK